MYVNELYHPINWQQDDFPEAPVVSTDIFPVLFTHVHVLENRSLQITTTAPQSSTLVHTCRTLSEATKGRSQGFPEKKLPFSVVAWSDDNITLTNLVSQPQQRVGTYTPNKKFSEEVGRYGQARCTYSTYALPHHLKPTPCRIHTGCGTHVRLLLNLLFVECSLLGRKLVSIQFDQRVDWLP